MATTWKLPRISKEFIGGVTVTANGVLVATFDIAIVDRTKDPVEADWRVPDVLAGKKGIIIGPGSAVGMLDKGDYRVWVRFTSNPEVPVIADVGIVILT